MEQHWQLVSDQGRKELSVIQSPRRPPAKHANNFAKGMGDRLNLGKDAKVIGIAWVQKEESYHSTGLLIAASMERCRINSQ